MSSDRHPMPGETLHGYDLEYFPGGKGLNQAIAARRAGVRTCIIGAVGSDAAGRELRTYLSDADVDVAHVNQVDAPTGVALITVANGDNTIIVVAGANAMVQAKQCDDVIFDGNDVVVAQYETPVDVTADVFAQAKQAGATTILNPAPAGEVSSELLQVTDFLVVNEHEYSLIFGEEINKYSPRIDENALKLLDGIVVTLGSEGVYLSADVNEHIAGEKVDVVDTTGAGDCFVGYFAALLSQEKSLRDAAALANRAAAMSTTRRGAAVSIPFIDEL